jgi:YbgC/YbaW family acyl-CoA thioester hydrolase
MPYEFTFSRRVEFAETDMAGIVHFANFYRMMENAEHAFFRSLGFSIHQDFDGQTIGWPRVSATCDFFRPLRFEETVDVQLLVAEVRTRSIRYAFRFCKNEGNQRVEVARGQVVTVSAALDRHTGKMGAVPIPEAVRAKIEQAPADLVANFSSSPLKQS